MQRPISFSRKGQEVHIWGFAGHSDSVASYKTPSCLLFQIERKTTTKLRNCDILSKTGPTPRVFIETVRFTMFKSNLFTSKSLHLFHSIPEAKLFEENQLQKRWECSHFNHPKLRGFHRVDVFLGLLAYWASKWSFREESESLKEALSKNSWLIKVRNLINITLVKTVLLLN